MFCSNPRLKSVNQKILFVSYHWLGCGGGRADTRKTVMVRKYSKCMRCKCWPSSAHPRHNNPDWGHWVVSADQGPHTGQGPESHLTTEDTWLGMTRVVSSVSHWWVQGSQESQITHRTGWPPATNWRWEGEMLRIAELGECQQRAGGRSALRPAAVPGFPPDIWTIARAGHGAALALSRYLKLVPRIPSHMEDI